MLDKTFIVIPAYNEAANIAQVLQDLLNNNYQNIIVIDDCSTDDTLLIAQKFPVHILHHKINRGQGAALQTGTDFALQHGAKIIVHFDADGQFLPQEIAPAIKPLLNSEIDILLGSRFLKQNKNMPWLKKNIIHPVSKIINNFFTGINLTDAHCGWRAMNRIAAQKIQISQDRMSHNTEIISQIKKYKLNYKEIPITVIYKEFGQGISGGIKILKDLFLNNFIK